MSNLYACLISDAAKEKLLSIAGDFAYNIEWLGDGVLFDISGLSNLIGKPSDIAKRIAKSLDEADIKGNVAIADNTISAMIGARNYAGISIISANELNALPLFSLDIEKDTLGVFDALGFKNVEDLKSIPESELISRYGTKFRSVLDTASNRGKHILSPNLKENKASWTYNLDHPAADFERLIFILRHGLEKVFQETAAYGFKTEQIEISLGLEKMESKNYGIKVSFPTLDIKFWLKIIDIRISMDPPEAEINSIQVTSLFIRPRTSQKGLYSATKPEPESLLLTVSKIKKLLGEENVGVPVILNQRLERPFALDAQNLPLGKETEIDFEIRPSITLNYFKTPLQAHVSIQHGRLIYLKTDNFRGSVKEYGGLWRGSSSWWLPNSWKSEEWDVEIADGGIYRLSKTSDGWFVTGEYD